MAYHCPFTSHHLLTVIKFSIINYQLSINKMNKPFIIDAHLDLSMNALEWNRDLRQPLKEINRREIGMTDKPDRGNATISFEELRKGNVGLVVATQIGRYVGPDNPLPGWHSPEQAWAQTQGQLAWYKAMEEEGQMVMIRDKKALEAHLALWKDGQEADRLCIKYRGRRLVHHGESCGKGVCLWLEGGWPGTLRPRKVCQRYGFYRSSECHGERVVAYHGSLGYDS